MAPLHPRAAHNDNVPGGEVGYGIGVCDETLSELSPINRIEASRSEIVIDVKREGEVVDLRTAGLHHEAGQMALALPRLTVSPSGIIVLLDYDDAGRIVVRRSRDKDRPFEFVTHEWHLARPDSPAHVTASPTGDYLAFRNEFKSRLQLVETRTGRVAFDQKSFGREHDGIDAHFHSDGRTVVIQRDGFIEILDLGEKVEFVKGQGFTHAMKDGDAPTSKRSYIEFDARGEIHALASRNRVVQFFKSEPLLLATLGPKGTYSHQFFEAPPKTHYEPSEVPADLDGFRLASFKYLDRPNQTGRGLVSPRETFAAEYRYQYHESRRESFLDVFTLDDRKHWKTMGVYGSITAMAFSMNERYLAIVTTKNSLRVYDLKSDHGRAWLAIDGLPLTEVPDLLSFTETGDILVGSTAGAKLLRYPRPD